MTIFKQNWGACISNRTVFGDKVYSDAGYFNTENNNTQTIEMLTPLKGAKGQSDKEKERHKAFNEVFSTAVSKVRQPLESFFS